MEIRVGNTVNAAAAGPVLSLEVNHSCSSEHLVNKKAGRHQKITMNRREKQAGSQENSFSQDGDRKELCPGESDPR